MTIYTVFFTPSYVSKYESGERRLDYLEVRNICDCCGITITEFDDFLGESEYSMSV